MKPLLEASFDANLELHVPASSASLAKEAAAAYNCGTCSDEAVDPTGDTRDRQTVVNSIFMANPASAPLVQPAPDEFEVNHVQLSEERLPIEAQNDLQTLVQIRVASCLLILAAGSALDYRGDVLVNAANEGCTGGFGIDEFVNKSGGPELKEARKELGGCKTGEAKVTRSFGHIRTTWIVHAVGPVYRINALTQGFDEEDARAAPYLSSLDPLLVSAYHAALGHARQLGARRVGFCLLSAGVFRGARTLVDVVQIGVRALAYALTHQPGSLEAVHLIAYSPEEQDVLRLVGAEVHDEIQRGGDGSGHRLVQGVLRSHFEGVPC